MTTNAQASYTEGKHSTFRVVMAAALFLFLLFLGPIFAAYMLPTLVMKVRKPSQSVQTTAIVNILVGWTGIGWFAMLMWASWRASE